METVAAAVVESPQVPPASTEPQCRHGALPKGAADDEAPGRKRAFALDQLLHAVQLGMSQKGLPFSLIFVNFVLEPMFKDLVDDEMTKMAVAFAVDKLLEGKGTFFPKFIASVAKSLEVCNRIGRDEFCRVVAETETPAVAAPLTCTVIGAAPPPMPEPKSPPEWYLDWKVETIDACPGGDIGSDKNLILYLSKHVPCDCLAATVEAVTRPGEAFPTCDRCGQMELFKKLLLCAKCKQQRYCSKECQVEDWKSSHKQHCGH